jgi:hypothetical protein
MDLQSSRNMAILSVPRLLGGHFSGSVVDDLWLCTSADIGQRPAIVAQSDLYNLQLHIFVHQLLGLFIDDVVAIRSTIKLDGTT